MPLQNRVDPFGALHAVTHRGGLMGNRGGRFHRDNKTLGVRRHASRRWIACVCEFRGRQREVWGAGYTELFFLDEATAFAAGHRPCFECRRADAQRFLNAFGAADVDEMDRVLDGERRAKRTHRMSLEALPDGAIIAGNTIISDNIAGACDAFLVCGDGLRRWSFAGLGAAMPRPRNTTVEVLTPPCVLAAFRRGYTPVFSAR